jgi:hypothetical protein
MIHAILSNGVFCENRRLFLLPWAPALAGQIGAFPFLAETLDE